MEVRSGLAKVMTAHAKVGDMEGAEAWQLAFMRRCLALVPDVEATRYGRLSSSQPLEPKQPRFRVMLDEGIRPELVSEVLSEPPPPPPPLLKTPNPVCQLNLEALNLRL